MTIYQKRALFILFVSLLLIVVFVQFNPFEAKKKEKNVSVWLTTGDQTNLLTEKPELHFSKEEKTSVKKITIDRHRTYQTMKGFGASLTGSSAYLINKKVDTRARNSLLNDLFTRNGINLNYVRHTIGASDFSVDEKGNPTTYTYDDVNGKMDLGLDQFSIQKDQDVVSVLQSILHKKNKLRIMGTPWTAPPWMKYGEKIHNGWYLNYTNEEIYKAYAEYFVRYIEAYKQKGIPIDSITVQNEPGHTSPDYPSMSMGAEEQAEFIGQYLGPAFESNKIKTSIMAYDHNWEGALDYATSLLKDEKASRYIAGTAFHCYEGTPGVMSSVHELFPDKNIDVTECSGGEWSKDFGDNLSWQMTNLIIDSPRNWAESVLMWNLALDEHNGPTNGGCQNCRGVVTINQRTGEITKNVEYYVLGHASKFVQPGAVRIAASTYKETIETVAYQNPDRSFVLIASNPSEEEEKFQVRDGQAYFTYKLPPQSAVTFVW